MTEIALYLLTSDISSFLRKNCSPFGVKLHYPRKNR